MLDEEEDGGIDYVASLETQGAIEDSESTQAALNENGIDQITVSFTGQMSFGCNIFVGEGGDSQMMGKMPVVVNFDSGTYFGVSPAYTHTRDDGQTITTTWVYEGIVSEEGVLRGTWTITACGWANKDVDCVGGPNPGVGIITEDGSGLYLYDLLDMDTEMLQLFETGRDAIVSARAGFMDPSEYPPTCRQR